MAQSRNQATSASSPRIVPGLADLYGLTAAQAAVTAYLFEGRSVDETAQLLGLSVNTVRSHLKHVFTKCEVHTQSELLHLLDLGPRSV